MFYKKYFFLILLSLLGPAATNFGQAPRLLFKIPTRSRPTQFFAALDTYYKNLSQEISCSFLISCDSDDVTMNNPTVIAKLHQYPNLNFYFDKSISKIHAYNRDIERHPDFDILVVASDDLIPKHKNFDKVIAQEMLNHFPNFDGVLNFRDGHVGPEQNTYPILGKNFYKQFNYVYFPLYQSLYSDSELTYVSRALGKEFVSNEVVLVHEHPLWTHEPMDNLYKKNEIIGHQYDASLYYARKAQNFSLGEKDWSILICTLVGREESFNFLYNKLIQQIKQAHLEDKIEVLFIKDNRELSIGVKRNLLLTASKGKYLNFIDDDDDVHDNYISMIYEKLKEDKDCVNLIGTITFDGKNPKTFIHSIAYSTYFEKDRVYYRPPNHLNPIKRCLAIQETFPPIYFGEDTEWAMKLVKKGLITTEATINIPYYFYLFQPKKKAALTHRKKI